MNLTLISFLLLFMSSFCPIGVFGSRGRGMTGPGRGQQQMQDKKLGKQQGMKNQHWSEEQLHHSDSTNSEHLLLQCMRIKWSLWCPLLLWCLSKALQKITAFVKRTCAFALNFVLLPESCYFIRPYLQCTSQCWRLPLLVSVDPLYQWNLTLWFVLTLNEIHWNSVIRLFFKFVFQVSMVEMLFAVALITVYLVYLSLTFCHSFVLNGRVRLVSCVMNFILFL